MTTEVAQSTALTVDPAIAESKRQAWGQLGVTIYTKDLEFQARAQASIAKLVIPTTIEEVVKAEAVLKEVKAEGVSLKNDRLAITRPVDSRMAELTAPEKSFEEPTKKVEQAIISLKKAEEERKRKEQQTIDAIRNCREFLTTTKNNLDSGFRNIILTKVNKAYEFALGDGDIKLDDLDNFIELALTRLSLNDFTYNIPKNTNSLISEEKYQALVKEIIVFDASLYLAEYENQLRLKFSDYAVALNNKTQALESAKLEAAKKAEEIKVQTENANLAAKIEAVAVTPVVSTPVKSLKQYWAIDMEENVESAISIMSAFAANIHLCLPKLNVSKWFSFTPAQAAVALAKVKNDDDKFQPSGIKFKTVDKL